MLQRRTIVAADGGCCFSRGSGTPLRAAETASAERHGALPRRHAACGRVRRSRALDQRMRAWQQHARISTRPSTPRAAPALAGFAPGLPSNLTDGAADRALHVQRAGLPLRQRLLSQRQRPTCWRARAGRHGARPHHAARIAGAEPRRNSRLARARHDLQLLHHPPHEDRICAPAGSTARCRSSMYSWRAPARPSAR